MKQSVLIFPLMICFLLMTEGLIHAQGKLALRPYGRIGILLTPPNTAELDYSVDGVPGGLDDQQEVKTTDFALGLQMLSVRRMGLALGGEIGFQNLFNSKITGGTTSVIFRSDDYDKEWDLYFGPLLEVSPPGLPFYLQGGAGLHIVFWQYISDFVGRYDTEYYQNGGVGTSFGIHGSLGMNLKLSPHLRIPLAWRTDVIFRYGVLIQTGLFFSIDLR